MNSSIFRQKSSVFFCGLTVALVLLLFGGISADAQCVQQSAKLLALDGAASDHFGLSVAISGTTAIVGAWGDDDNGASSGSAYLFDTTTGLQIAKLVPDDNAAGDRFGNSVAISGATAIIGARYGNDNYNGSAYLFDTTTGQQISELVALDGAASDWFGLEVAISGTTAIVGAYGDDDNGGESGSAYLFDTTTGLQIAKLVPDDNAATDQFGYSVAISGTTAIVGARLDDDNGENSGSAYLFDATTGQQIAKLLPDDGAEGDTFGGYVAISGTTAIVGATRDDDNGENSGSAYLFDTTTGLQTYKLLPNDGAAEELFGRVAISGNVAIVGARWDDDNGEISGSAYLFDTTTGQQIAKLLPDDGAADDRFGSVAIAGTTAIVGAQYGDGVVPDCGAAYLFEVSCSDVVTADSYLVTRGTFVSGGIVELAESDNLDLSIQRSIVDVQSRTEFEVMGTSPTASPTSFDVTLEGAVFARSTVVQTIALWDYVAGAWELVDTRNATNMVDSIATVVPTGDLSRFVDQTTLEVKAHVHFQSPVARQRFASNTDQFMWTIGQ